MEHQLIHIPEVESTNQRLGELLRSENLEPPICLYTDYQTQGRGRRSKQWESEEGSNILASFLCNPPPRTRDLPMLNMAACLAVRSCLESFGISGTEIKWPNDILYQRSKIAGILVENVLEGSQVKHSIIGIGLNVNQKYFPRFSACSMYSISNKNFNREEVLKQLYSQLYKHLSMPADRLLQLTNQVLFGRDSLELFKNSEEEYKAKVLKMNDKGNLLVQREAETLEIAHHQTKWML